MDWWEWMLGNKNKKKKPLNWPALSLSLSLALCSIFLFRKSNPICDRESLVSCDFFSLSISLCLLIYLNFFFLFQMKCFHKYDSFSLFVCACVSHSNWKERNEIKIYLVKCQIIIVSFNVGTNPTADSITKQIHNT